MLTYDLRIALKSLRRTPVLTVLLIAAIAVGICVSTTFVALRHLLGKDPLPGASRSIFCVRMDSWGPASAWNPDDPKSLPTQLTYRDMSALMRSNIPTRQTGSFISNFFVFPDPKIQRPYSTNVRVVHSDFFPMFRVPFRLGGPWPRSVDEKPEQVVVIDDETNQKVFRGANSIGRNLRIGEQEYRVVGVLAPWRPTIRFYDMTGVPTAPPEHIYMPLSLTQPLKIATSGNSDGWSSAPINTFDDFLGSEQVWIQFWVELPTPAKQAEYTQFVKNYITDQKKLGRFQRPLYFKVKSMPDMLDEFNVVPQPVKSMSVVSVLFLVVCSMNLVGLLLGKFLARVPEVSVRRALGASRMQVFAQHVVECELVGVAGGVIGIALSAGVLALIARLVPNGEIIRMDGEVVAIALFLSLGAGLLAGLYPSWRICSIPPAMQLKIQ